MKIDHPSAPVAKRVAIWIRVSTEDQAAGDSPKHHEARARHYAASRDWNVVELYDLAGVSGKAVMDHPESRRMMADIERGHITGLIFSKLARLTRNARELMDFSDFFRKHEADLISLQENIDTSTPSGRLFFNIVAVMAQWEREEITDRIRASVAIRAKLGKPLGGQTPYGYVWDKEHIKPAPKEAPVRKLIYELFSEHRRLRTVARLLNERGYRTRNGGKWSDTTINRLIRDTTAKGIYRANYTKRIDGKSHAIKPEHEWVLSDVEPIITDELWDRCNDLLEGRKTRNERPGRKPVHLFAGLVICECGKKLYVPSNNPKYICFSCHNKIPVADLESLFLDELKGYLISEESVSAYFSGMNAAAKEKEKLIDSDRKELERVTRESDATYRLYLDGGLNTDQFKERYQPLDARKKQIAEELPRLESELSLMKIDGVSQEVIMREALNLHAKWESMPLSERRRLVELLIRTIVVGKDEVTFNICYIPRIEELTERQRTVRDSWQLQA